MDRKQNLIALRDAIVDGDVKNDGSMFLLFGDAWLHPFDANNGDMNAALAFVAEVLPEWRWNVYPDRASVFQSAHINNGKRYDAVNDTPARALLIATLNALIQMEDV